MKKRKKPKPKPKLKPLEGTTLGDMYVGWPVH